MKIEWLKTTPPDSIDILILCYYRPELSEYIFYGFYDEDDNTYNIHVPNENGENLADLVILNENHYKVLGWSLTPGTYEEARESYRER